MARFISFKGYFLENDMQTPSATPPSPSLSYPSLSSPPLPSVLSKVAKPPKRKRILTVFAQNVRKHILD